MRRKDFLLISIFTFITVVAGIGFTIYHTLVTTTTTPELQKRIEPIAPTFDGKTIEVIKRERKPVNLLEESALPTPVNESSPASEIATGGAQNL